MLKQIKRAIDRVAETLIPEGSYLSAMPVKLALYVLVFLGLPLLILVSLPYGVGLLALIGVIALLIFGIPNF